MHTKQVAILFLLILTFFSLAQVSFGQSYPCSQDACPTGKRIEGCCIPDINTTKGGGLVPCGSPCCPCSLCDLFELINRIVKFLLFKIIPILGALMIAIGGFMLMMAYVGEGGAETISKAKKLFTSAIIGLLIIYCAWGIVNLFLQVVGVAEWTGLDQWWIIDCGNDGASSGSYNNIASQNKKPPSQGDFIPNYQPEGGGEKPYDHTADEAQRLLALDSSSKFLSNEERQYLQQLK